MATSALHARTLKVLDHLGAGEAGLTVVAASRRPFPHRRHGGRRPAEPDLTFVQALLDERAPGPARVTGLTWSRSRAQYRFAASGQAHGIWDQARHRTQLPMRLSTSRRGRVR